MRTDGFQGRVSLGQSLIVPEPNHAKAFRFQETRSRFVYLCELYVVTTIEFDNQRFLNTYEIHDVRRHTGIGALNLFPASWRFRNRIHSRRSTSV